MFYLMPSIEFTAIVLTAAPHENQISAAILDVVPSEWNMRSAVEHNRINKSVNPNARQQPVSAADVRNKNMLYFIIIG